MLNCKTKREVTVHIKTCWLCFHFKIWCRLFFIKVYTTILFHNTYFFRREIDTKISLYKHPENRELFFDIQTASSKNLSPASFHGIYEGNEIIAFRQNQAFITSVDYADLLTWFSGVDCYYWNMQGIFHYPFKSYSDWF